MSIRAVGFDLDGTLYPGWIMYLYSIPWFLKNRELVLNFMYVRKKVRTLGTIDNLEEVQAEMLAQRLSYSVAATRRLLKQRVYGEWTELLRFVPIFHGLRELLQQLRARGIPLGVMSDFPVDHKLSLLSLEHGWDAKISSEVIGHLKPHRAPFEVLCERLGTAPAEILYVGNSYSYDVRGAKGLGIQCAHLTHRPRKDSIADVSFYSYKRLWEWLAPRLAH